MKARIKKTLADIPDITDIEAEVETGKVQKSIWRRIAQYDLYAGYRSCCGHFGGYALAASITDLRRVYDAGGCRWRYSISLKGEKFATGDVIAFYYNNKILGKAGYRQRWRLGGHC